MSLFKSRKFLLISLDALVAVIGLVVGFFLQDADWQRFILALVAALQPVFVAAIVGVAVEDAAAFNAGSHPNQQ